MKKWKLLYVVIISSLALVLLLPAAATHASEAGDQAIASKLHIETEVGYNGMFMSGKSVPVKIKLTNVITRDLKGELVLNIRDANGASVAHIMPLEITAGSTVEAVMTADGDFSKVGTWVQFYEGGVDKGKAVEVSGTRYAEGKNVAAAHAIGIAASDPDTLNFIAFFNNNGYNTSPIVLGEHFYAGSSHDLSMFSVLALNDVAVSQWSEQKVQAIKEWVAAGGMLLVGGGAGYSQTATAFADLLPVEGSNTVAWSNANLLMEYVGGTEPLGSLQIVNGKLVRGQVILEDEGIPIIAEHTYGHGKVVYTAFDLGLKPFANWDGRTALLEGILNEQLTISNQSNPPNYWWGLDRSASYFPRLQSPQVGGLFVIFVIYTLIVAPIIYMVLRRFDRREWSWWIIPSLAVLSTIVIVMIGTRDKSELYVNAVKVAQIEGDIVREVATNKVFIPNSKDITMAMPEQAYVRMNGQGSSSGAEVSTSKEQRIYYKDGSREVTFTNNKYWTTKSVMLDERIYDTAQYGTLHAELEQQDGSYLLNITNDTGQDVNHVSLLVNSQIYYIGALVSGEQTSYTLPPSLTFGNSIQQYYGGLYSSTIVNNSGLQWEQLERERSLLDHGTLINHIASIIAFSYSDDEQYVVNGKAVKSDEMTMWVVDIADSIMAGLQQQQAVAPTNISMIDEGSYTLSEQKYITLHQGTLLFKYHLPLSEADSSTAGVGQIVPDINSQHFGAQFSIYNEELDVWEPITDEKIELTPYLSPFNILQVKLESPQNYYEGSAPLLLLDREVQ